MDFPSTHFTHPVYPARKHLPPEGRTASSEHTNSKSSDAPTTRGQWVSRIIEAQASRVVHDTSDAVELKPVTVESQPPANIQRFLDIAAPHAKWGRIIDTYA